MPLPQYQYPINTLVSMTIDAKLDEIVDGIFISNALFQRLYQNYQGGNSRAIRYRGGMLIRSAIWYNKMPAYSYGPGTTFGTAKREFQTDLQFEWKQAAAELNVYGLDVFRNQSDVAQIFDYVETATINAFNSLADEIGFMIFGTEQDPTTGQVVPRTFQPTDWDGLYNGILDTGTYGGIPRSPSFGTPGYAIRSQVFDAGGAPISFSLMQRAYGAVTFNRTRPDLIVTTQKIWDQIWARSQPSERNQPGPLREVGFETVRFNGAEVVVDHHVLPGEMYLLNTNFIELWLGEGNDFIRRSKRDGFDNGYPNPVQDSYIDQVICYGNLVVSGPRYQAKIINIAE